MKTTNRNEHLHTIMSRIQYDRENFQYEDEHKLFLVEILKYCVALLIKTSFNCLVLTPFLGKLVSE